MQIERLFEIVYILMSDKNITAKKLAERFEVSQRTIYRDIDILSSSGVPIYTNRGRNGGIKLVENFVLNKSLLSKNEQENILSSLYGLKAFNIENVDTVLSKLNAIFNTSYYDWIEVDFSTWNNYKEIKINFEILKKSILNCTLIKITYIGVNDKTYIIRIIEPIKLIFKGNNWYVYGFCRKRNDFRLFKLTRITEIEVLNEVFVRKIYDNKVDFYEKEGSTKNNEFEVCIKVDKSMAFRVYDEFDKENIKIGDDENFYIKFKATYCKWLFSYIISYGNNIEVIEPENIRYELIDTYKQILNKYEKK